MTRLRQWVVCGVLAVVGVLAAGWFLAVAPARSDAAALDVETTAQLAANDRVRTQLQVLQAQADALPEQERRLAAVAEKIPDAARLPELIRALTEAAEDGDVEFVSLVPGPPSPVAATAAAAPAVVAEDGTAVAAEAAPAVGEAGTLNALPVTINVVGGYYQVERYLSALEDLPRALRISGLALAPGENPVAGGKGAATVDDGQSLAATITGTVYVASGAQPLPAASASATPSTTEG